MVLLMREKSRISFCYEFHKLGQKNNSNFLPTS